MPVYLYVVMMSGFSIGLLFVRDFNIVLVFSSFYINSFSFLLYILVLVRDFFLVLVLVFVNDCLFIFVLVLISFTKITLLVKPVG